MTRLWSTGVQTLGRLSGCRQPALLSWCVTLLAAVLLFNVTALPARAQWFDEDAEAALDEEENPFAPGLIARFRGPDGVEHVKLVDGLSHVWNNLSPDRRLPPGPFSVTLTGRLWTQAPGIYKLRVYAAGHVQLSVHGQRLLDSHSDKPDWLAAEPIELGFGFHRLEVQYRRTTEPARIALFWEGPQFRFEPVASRWLLHDRDQTPSPNFERGAHLVRGLRCAACHELPGEAEALPAPALTSLSDNLSRDWLVRWLSAPQENNRAPRRMPHFAFSTVQAAAIADTLLTASDPLPPSTLRESATSAPPSRNKKQKSVEPEPPPPSAELGATLFRSIGCLACHRVGNLGTDGLFGGGDLSHVGGKRPAEFFARWLNEPARFNRDHRMPVFPLTADQRTSLSLYLQTLEEPPAAREIAASPSDVDGMSLVRQAGCASCHALPRLLASDTSIHKTPLSPTSITRNEDTCLADPSADGKRPGYRLSEDYRRAIRTFLKEVAADKGAPANRSGHDLLAERNCLACHARGWTPGIAGRLPAVADADASLADVLPALQPPALHGIGDKLQDRALVASLDAPDRPRRPWLRIRMPKFDLSPEETTTIVDHFIAADRIPPSPDANLLDQDASLSTSALDAAGPRLVTADGFGCTSCHAIGKWEPQKVALNAHGSALSNIGQRVRREWFDRWVRNPARIVPQMEMPSVQQPVRGVLDARLDEQLAAVWRVLNRPDFTPPSPNALRVVRRANLPEVAEPAAVLTEVIEIGDQLFIKPLVIGMANRHNVLIDLATSRMAAWWIGDTARQQTRGKSWYWEAGMPQLLSVRASENATSDLSLLHGKQTILPDRIGQFVTEFDTVEHTGTALRFTQRLHFSLADKPTAIHVTQEFDPLANQADQPTGFRRKLTLANAPSDARWRLLALPGEVSIAADGRAAVLNGPRGSVQVSLSAVGEPDLRFEQSPLGAAIEFAAQGGQPATCTLEYRSEATPDRFPPLPQVDRTLERMELAVVPGFDAVQLPVTDEVMPTGLCWRPDGTLVVSSLEGRVWLAHDTDGDEIEDQLLPFSDDLAAPYGVAANGDAIDVINKFGLLRLTDTDDDGTADRIECIASGWGHTRDYHDWAIGLPRDAEGNYYVALPCQQDHRSEAAANLRGRAIKLVPREPSDDDPQRYTIEEICAGLRFPQGIALSPTSELFATDNQGNYNPFNELNHLVPGARYGFINRLEYKPGFNPPFQTAAIEIPHPWTRSVNGLCFLVLPEDMDRTNAAEYFGPFAGHAIGCEYDTRRLVRMTLERVAGEYQGAVYPFSREPMGEEPTFEGPLVCQVAPDGDLYLGSIRDSGWGAGSNTGSLVRLRRKHEFAPG